MGFVISRPALADVPQYMAALRRGWSPDNVRGEAAALEELDEIADYDAAKAKNEQTESLDTVLRRYSKPKST